MNWTDYENRCREKSDRILSELTDEDRLSISSDGLSVDHVVSVMAVTNCDLQTAIIAVKAIEDYEPIDWSEATWIQIHDTTVSALTQSVLVMADKVREILKD